MWLLLLALPLQGFAAATMLTCGPNHHRSSNPAGVVEVHQHQHQHQHQGQHAGHDKHAHDPAGNGAQAASVADLASDPAPSAHSFDKVSKSKCSACAACCIGAALPAAALVFARFDVTESPAASTSASRVGFFTDGPDRPPRIALG